MQELYKLYKTRCSQLIKKCGLPFDYKVLEIYDYFKDLMSYDDFNLVLKEKRSRHSKRNRTSRHIYNMLRYMQYQGFKNRKLWLVFGTGTINDTMLERKEETRLKLLSNYLKKHYDVAIVNIDYGDKTERLHYHWIGLSFDEPIPQTRNGKQCKSKKGFPLFVIPGEYVLADFVPTVEPVVTTDLEQIRNYLLKLNNHSQKVKTRIRIIKRDSYITWLETEVSSYREQRRKKIFEKWFDEAL